MRILVTGSAGHLGEALMRTLREPATRRSASTSLPVAVHHRVGSIADREFVRACMRGVDAVMHAATLHKPHVATHSRQDFVDTNITGTLNLLEEAVAAQACAPSSSPAPPAPSATRWRRRPASRRPGSPRT